MTTRTSAPQPTIIGCDMQITLPSPDATAAAARALGRVLRPGDAVLMTGDIGAGKTHFARSLIQSLQDHPEDVPSPTFTLVQAYDTRAGEVWHTDLYRLTGPAEIEELGLLDAFETAICLVEWPDRLAGLTPVSALHLTFADGRDENSRTLRLTWNDPRWSARLTKAGPPFAKDPAEAFLHAAGWGGSTCEPLAGDASSRRYARVTHRDEDTTAILMDDPQGDTAQFVRLARHLTGLGLSAPVVLHEAPGFLLLEDLGDGLIARLALDADSEKRLYLMATDALIALHAYPAPRALSEASPAHLAEAIAPAFVHYAPDTAHGRDLFDAARATFEPLLAAHAAPEGVLVLRDYHAENILSLPGRTGASRAGLLDFQDAVVGHSAYDLVSLCRDVRRDVRPETEAACIASYLAATGDDPDGFAAAYALLGVQRNLRILGIFARLSKTFGKPRYLAFLPRTWSHIQAQLAHPVLAPLRPIIAQLPAPTPAHIESLRPDDPSP